ncbi:MAG: ABC transporter ATP-binding protein [Anaerolineae bacterium]
MITVIGASNLTKIYVRGTLLNRIAIRALDEVDLTVRSEDGSPRIISLVGESGSGKTTFAKVLLRLVRPNTGQVVVYDRVLVGEKVRPDKQEFLSMIQPIFQEPSETFSAYQPIDSYLRRTATQVSRLVGRAATEAIEDALASVGLKYADVKGKYLSQFSGGELQRLSIARALIASPKLIVADEPVSMLDASLRMNVINLFLRLKEEYGTSFLYVTHDLSTAYYISDYIAVMYRGSICEFGKARDVLRDPQHPYTQLLLSSIAVVGKKWPRDDIRLADMETQEYQLQGCKFQGRCPYAEPICARERPRQAVLDDQRQVYCHLFTREKV